MSRDVRFDGFDTDVLVVGAGPTGLALSTALASQGRRVLTADKTAATDHTSRAAVVHARTLEVLEPLGVTGTLIGQGKTVRRFTVRDRDRVLMPVTFDGIPSTHPYALMVPQYVTEEVLADRLTTLGGEVSRPWALESLTQDDTGVSAHFANGRTVRARLAVGCDGMHSTVRDQAGIALEGGTYSDSFALADVEISGGVPTDEVVLYFSPDGPLVVAPLPDGLHRIVGTVAHAPDKPDREFAQHLLDTRGPRREPAHVERVEWGSHFRVHHGIATRYREGRVMLAGDAAHVHSPAGGQGMNAGIVDAVTLAPVLGAVLDGAPLHHLDTYEASRRPVARGIITMTDRMTRLAVTDRRLRPVRNLLIAAAGKVPAVPKRLALRLSGVVHPDDTRPPTAPR
jgi:2-polyprenyl-6-methoxyphenol hydroxylase-like FAD-dependent oxidoreductase